MKNKILILILIGLGVSVAFQNCAGASHQGVDEFGQTQFVEYDPDQCTTGKLCKTDTELNCYDPIFFFQADKNVVCQRSSIE